MIGFKWQISSVSVPSFVYIIEKLPINCIFHYNDNIGPCLDHCRMNEFRSGGVFNGIFS